MTWNCWAFPLKVLVLSLALSAPIGPAFAQENEERAELARQVMDLHRQEGYLERAIEAAMKNVPAEQRSAIEEAVSKIDKDAIYEGWAEKVEETYTVEEMKAYLDYATTDVGRSALRKNTEISAKVYEVLLAEISAAMSRE